MTSSEPLLPHPGDDERIAAADPGRGGPEPAPGFGVGGEDPDIVDEEPDTREPEAETPFRTPEPPQQ